jgi:hypothetical protein
MKDTNPEEPTSKLPVKKKHHGIRKLVGAVVIAGAAAYAAGKLMESRKNKREAKKRPSS